MIIESLEIRNFRNIKNSVFEPNNEINIIYGENANGKTSFIESIYSVSNLKSFRTLNLSEVINDNSNVSLIDCFYEKNSSKENLKLEIKKTNKIYKKNNTKNKIEDYLWSLFSIVFMPDDIYFVNGSPGKKRDLLDKAIFYTDKTYINILKNYYKIISNKNINLKNNKITEIEHWNILIAKYSSIIVSMRNNYINRMNLILSDYLNSFESSFKIDGSFNVNENDLQAYFLEELNNNIDREIKYKYSIVGAHRQNIDFCIDNKNLKVFGSQGQKRSFILLFRSAQIIDFENIHSFVPILLLDDMASELDDKNKYNFFKILDNFSGQIFITTTDKNLFSKSDKVKYFCVENGNINSFS